LLASCHGGEADRREDVEPAEVRHRTTITAPRVLEGLPIGPPDASGRPTVAPCGTCHEAGETTPLPVDASGIAGPHEGLELHHGDIVCASCHAAEDRSALHLASGTTVPMTDALRLCAQCHGPQYRDYRHGAHGGMRGYWDLSRGPRERNHCVSCHDPHAPAFGQFEPVAGPRDRFTVDAEPQGASHE
jgi:hypothetical protein